MARHFTEPPPKDDGPHPSQDTTRRHEDDARLRRNGFKIHSRQKGREAVWERQGVLYTYTAALREVGS